MNREERKLTLTDICGYLPHGIEFAFRDTKQIIGKCFTLNEKGFYKNGIPVLRPLQDLYRTITHNGQEIIPICEIAKLIFPHADWSLDSEHTGCCCDEYLFHYNEAVNAFRLFDNSRLDEIENTYLLYDRLHEYKVDYRNLIENNLAVSVYDLEKNPYE
jgi:hypothetical protein